MCHEPIFPVPHFCLSPAIPMDSRNPHPQLQTFLAKTQNGINFGSTIALDTDVTLVTFEGSKLEHTNLLRLLKSQRERKFSQGPYRSLSAVLPPRRPSPSDRYTVEFLNISRLTSGIHPCPGLCFPLHNPRFKTLEEPSRHTCRFRKSRPVSRCLHLNPSTERC